MDVTAIAVFVSASGDRRGRICWRPDGRFHVVTETLQPETGDELPWWKNDWPPSGIFDHQDAALSALSLEIRAMTPMENVRPVTFDMRIGPYPEPEY